MPIIVCGINHKTAPLAVREQVIFALDKLPVYLADLQSNENITEAVLLSTCNRSELYCEANSVQQVLAWFHQQHALAIETLAPALYTYQAEAAVRHMMNVACGLDSMILGEPQILGQMKAAFSESCAAGSVGPIFNKLFQHIFAVAKEVRTNTAIGACPVSVASAAVNLAKQYLPDKQAAKIVLLGAGATSELILRYLRGCPWQTCTIVNRNQAKALTLARTYGANAVPLTQLAKVLQHCDLVISATGSAKPLITKTMLASRSKPLTMIDVAVRRDIEPAVAALPFVKLYCIDDLKEAIQHNLRGREHAAEKAREVIAARSQDFYTWLQSINLVATTIKAYRQQIEDISQVELSKAMRQLHRGDDPLQVLTAFAYAFTNKLLHTPCVQLRQAGVDGRMDILQLAQQLFAIQAPDTELL